MKDFSICRDKDFSNPDKLSWDEFGEIMKKDNVSEALIYYTSDNYTEIEIAKKYIYKTLIEKDNVKVWAGYSLMDNEDNNKLRPCLVLLDADIKYVITRAIMDYKNTFIIQCIFMDTGEFKVNKYDLEFYDDTGFSVN